MAKITPGYRGKCLHCQTIVKFESPASNNCLARVIAENEQVDIHMAQCPECLKLIITIEKLIYQGSAYRAVKEQIVWPLSSGRPPAPADIPESIAQDYNEASLVLPYSAKASAALSRRCLQAVLKHAGNATEKDLSSQIDKILPSLPTYIAENLDAVRHIGNFAAHELKSKITGEILDVEPEEAEWNLDVLDSLFDFYYVKPRIEENKRQELNKKLEAAGKPPIKSSPSKTTTE